MEGVQCLKELVMPLCLMSQWAHITIRNRIHKLELWRQFRLSARILFVISILPYTHVVNYLGDVEGLWLFI